MSETHTPEIRPATDEQIVTLRAGLAEAFPARDASDLAAQMVSMILLARIESDRATIAELRETNARLNRRVTKAEGVVLSKARDESAAGRSLGRALANAACSAMRAQNEELLAALEACLGIVTGEQMNKKALIDALEKSKAAIQKAKESR